MLEYNFSSERNTKIVGVYNQENIPSLRFPEFSGEWKIVKLNKLLKFKNGFNTNKENYGKGIKFINVSDILENNYLTYENINESVSVSKKNLDNYSINYGDIVFQRSSENREEVGTANVYLDSKTCVFGGFVIRGQKNNEYNPYFLKELLNSTSTRKEITSWSGGTTRYNIGQDTLNKISIKLPNITEQSKIANFILTINKKIDLMEKKHYDLLIYLKETRTKILNNNSYKLYEFRLKDLSKINKGKQLNKTDMEYYGNYYVLNGGKNPSGYTNSWNVAKNTISISEGGNSCGFVKFNKDNFYCGGHCFYLTLTSDLIKTELLYHCLKENEKQIMKLRVGTGLPNIQKKDLENFKFNIPLRNQQEITNLLNNLNYNITLIHNNIYNLKKYKKGLLQKMFC